MTNIPCRNCVCIAVCRLKHFIDMRIDCILVTNFLLSNGNKADGYEFRIELIHTILKPVKWGYLRSHDKETLLDTRQDNNYNYIPEGCGYRYVRN